MPEFNLLESVPDAKRSLSQRAVNKEENRAIALEFGREYFDGPREQGYGGYTYDGRWVKVAKNAVSRYSLKPGDRVLDVGCAKGFFVHDLKAVCPGLDAFGVDISDYALANGHSGVEGILARASADHLPFGDGEFDAVFAINTLHNLDRTGCLAALKEMQRVCKNKRNCFVQVDAYRDAREYDEFVAWMLTAQTYEKPDGWLQLFEEAGYVGDYFWTILTFVQSAE